MPDALGRPVRIQRRRTRGWRMPAGAVYVGRPTKWGNRWTPAGYEAAGYRISDRGAVLRICVAAYRAWLLGEPHWAHGSVLPPVPDLAPLVGRDLACWCPIISRDVYVLCHADVLIEVANR